jgi:hypothetical protein
MTTSITLTSEVMPAMTSDPKNRTPSSAPAGASLMIVGKAMKARPMPAAGDLADRDPAGLGHEAQGGEHADAGEQLEAGVREAHDEAGADHVLAAADVRRVRDHDAEADRQREEDLAEGGGPDRAEAVPTSRAEQRVEAAPAPGSSSACTTRAAKASTSTGMRTSEVTRSRAGRRVP